MRLIDKINNKIAWFFTNGNKEPYKAISVMKGTLQMVQNVWTVKYVDDSDNTTLFPLHMDQAKKLNDLMQVFDNLEARIANDPIVEFEVQTICDGTDEFNFQDMDVAVLTNNSYI